jgi:hypothetical protein
MRAKAEIAGIRSSVSPTRGDPREFFYEIWQETGDGNRWQIRISRQFLTAAEARKACDDEVRWCIAERCRSHDRATLADTLIAHAAK